MTPIADTGLLVGFLDRSDQYHHWAVQAMDGLRVALVTCEAVIAETEYLVPGSGPAVMEMVQRSTLHIAPMLPDEASALAGLMQKYVRMQFADACVVRLSEKWSDAVVYTTDKRDFNIYRRHGNKPIKCVSP